MNLKILEYQKIFSLFKEKKWNIDKENKYSLYNRFLTTYSSLEEDEKKLFLELSYNFTVVNLDDYLKQLCELLEKMMSSSNYLYKNEKDIYVMPLIPKKDDKKIKSSTIMTYLFSSKNLAYLDCLAEKNFILIDNYEQLSKKSKNIISKNKPLILADDFIGSGNQALESVNDVLDQGISKNQISIVTPYAHEMGVKKIQENGIEMFCENIINKGVSHNSKNKKYLELMKVIEERMKIDSRNNLGYMESEALISLIRTPNNTFPIFWYKGARRKNFAPFPRK